MTDWFKVASNMASNTGTYKAIIEGLLREDCSEESKAWYAAKFEETKAKDIYEGASK
jgi:hypothetical protein